MHRLLCRHPACCHGEVSRGFLDGVYLCSRITCQRVYENISWFLVVCFMKLIEFGASLLLPCLSICVCTQVAAHVFRHMCACSAYQNLRANAKTIACACLQSSASVPICACINIKCFHWYTCNINLAFRLWRTILEVRMGPRQIGCARLRSLPTAWLWNLPTALVWQLWTTSRALQVLMARLPPTGRVTGLLSQSDVRIYRPSSSVTFKIEYVRVSIDVFSCALWSGATTYGCMSPLLVR